MAKKISIEDWLELKPYGEQTATDSYYLKICNDVKKVIITNKHSFVLQSYLYNEDSYISFLSCFLTSYFEDLISGTNIWNSFVRVHQRLYGKQLPFYKLDQYYEEEINPQDISFLIWYVLNTLQDEEFVSPFRKFIVETAEEVFDVFDKEWEHALKNKHLKTFYQIDQKENDYYIARNLIDTVLFKTYLFYPDTLFKLQKQEVKIIQDIKNEGFITSYLNDNRDWATHSFHTRLLSLKGKEWVAEILGENHLLSKDFLNISKKIQGLFLYKGQDKNNIFLEHIASSKKFNLTKESFDHSQELKELDTILLIGIVMWKDEWWFSGVYFQKPFNADIVLSEKNSLKSRRAVNFLDHQKPETEKVLKKQFSAFKEFNNGSHIAFLPSAKIEEFCKEYTTFYNNSLNLSEEEVREAKQRIRNDGFFGSKEKHFNYSEISETGLVFFNPNKGIEIALAVNSAFPVPSNPYFKEEDSEEHVLRLLMHESLSAELAMYCIDNCKDKLPFFTKSAGKDFLEDIDFLLRFWKKDNYHKTPTITFTGRD